MSTEDLQDRVFRPSQDVQHGAKLGSSHVLASDVGSSEIWQDQFFIDNPLPVRFRRSVSFNLKSGPTRLSEFVCNNVTVQNRIPGYNVVCIAAYIGKTPAWIMVDWREKGEITPTKVAIVSSLEACDSLIGLLKAEFDIEHEPMAKWWFRGERGVEERKIYMPKVNQDIRPELYPNISDPRDYIRRYLNSDGSILLMAGPPGTGKTTLLRYMICHHRLYASIVYDETLMQSDALFQSFLFDNNSDILVIEDADTILSSREHDANKLMSRFLNVSDGLIKLPNKKVVFTTNITDFGKVDPALLRPGRCYDVLHTRPLNLTEAQAAAKVCNLPIPTQKQEYTLADYSIVVRVVAKSAKSALAPNGEKDAV